MTRLKENVEKSSINEVSWHRKVEETTGFWEEMREAHGHTSWWANGMCANYADYIDRKQMWTDVEFRALGFKKCLVFLIFVN